MTSKIIEASVARIAKFEGYDIQPLARDHWEWGDYVVGEVTDPPAPTAFIELSSGRLANVDVGDQVMGAFAARFATLESTGTWEKIGDNGRTRAMTSAGLFGVITSRSPFGLDHVRLRYRGHVLANGVKRTMAEFADAPISRPFAIPSLLIVGSSMSAIA